MDKKDNDDEGEKKMLNETSLKNLENSEYRLEIFKKYSALEKPAWKRVDYKYEEPAEYKDFNNTTLRNDKQQGLEVRDIKNSLEDLKRLESENEYGLGDFSNYKILLFIMKGNL